MRRRATVLFVLTAAVVGVGGLAVAARTPVAPAVMVDQGLRSASGKPSRDLRTALGVPRHVRFAAALDVPRVGAVRVAIWRKPKTGAICHVAAPGGSFCVAEPSDDRLFLFDFTNEDGVGYLAGSTAQGVAALRLTLADGERIVVPLGVAPGARSAGRRPAILAVDQRYSLLEWLDASGAVVGERAVCLDCRD